MGSFRIYGGGPTLAYPSSADAAFVDATVKALLDSDRTTAVVVDRSRVLYLFLGRDPTDEGGGWQRYVAEYVADDEPPAAALAALERELAKLRLDDWGWACHPRDEAWLDALGRATAASNDDVAVLARLAGGGEPPLSFGVTTADRAVAVATALARADVSAAIVDGDGTPPATADVILRPGHEADFVPLCDRSEELWEWKRDDAPSGRGSDTSEGAGATVEHTPTPAAETDTTGRGGTGSGALADTDEGVATDGGGLAAVLGRTGAGRHRPSITAPSRVTATALGLALVVVAGLAVATTAVVGAGPFATGTGGSLDGAGSAGPATATETPTAAESVVTLSASVTGRTVTVRGWGASDGLTVALVDGTGETVASRQVEAGTGGFRARLSAPGPGPYRVVARNDGTTVEKDVRVTAEGTADAAFGLDTPERGATVRSGTLRVSGRSPTDSVVVRIADATGTRVLRTNTSVSGGEFETWITGLPDGQYTLTVAAAGDRRTTRTVAFD
ncbi:hypothetical protein ACOZ4N_17050 [Halorientalis pallida]|uniref:hypothetical protein n=1 Tax=Halorientalis pallida TaxID=2479928 RepID=UPI003C6FE037